MRRLGLVALVGAALAVRVWLAVVLWEPGWSALTWDDFSRVAYARTWAGDPSVVPDLIWLPLPIWVYGTVFRIAGSWFIANPMLLAALFNTVLMFVVAAVSAWTARRLFASNVAAVAAGLAVLYAPWGVWLSLSGLSEPMYFVTVAVAMAGTVGWLQQRRRSLLVVAAVAIAAGAACRYEGWMMMGAWAVVLGWRELRTHRHDPTPGVHPLWIIAAPALVPISWALLNQARTGNPLYFAEESARIFLNAFGPLYGVVSRLIYYPASLLRAAPLIIPIAAVVVLLRRRDPMLLAVAAIPALAFGVLWGSSLVSPAVGAFNERYLFAFAVAVTPIAAGLPIVAAAAGAGRRMAPVALSVFVGVAVIWAASRYPHTPEEWTVAPDLLTVAAALGKDADPADPLTVVVGEGMENDVTALVIRNGGALHVVVAGSSADPTRLAPGEILLERIPARIAANQAEPAARIGRYALYGMAAPEVPPCPGCTGWTHRDETGAVSQVITGGYVPLEFLGNDPVPGAETTVWIDVMAPGATAVLEVRSLYGHGFNPGRLDLQVRRDGELILQRDIAEHSRWITVDIPLPADQAAVRIEVAVVARPGIETGWGWGRASTVLIRSLTVTDR